MRAIAVMLFLVSVPSFAEDYSPPLLSLVVEVGPNHEALRTNGKTFPPEALAKLVKSIPRASDAALVLNTAHTLETLDTRRAAAWLAKFYDVRDLAIEVTIWISERSASPTTRLEVSDWSSKQTLGLFTEGHRGYAEFLNGQVAHSSNLLYKKGFRGSKADFQDIVVGAKFRYPFRGTYEDKASGGSCTPGGTCISGGSCIPDANATVTVESRESNVIRGGSSGGVALVVYQSAGDRGLPDTCKTGDTIRVRLEDLKMLIRTPSTGHQ